MQQIGCDAPITCRSLDPSSRNSPTFVNQSIVKNLHIKGCKYSAENLEKQSASDNQLAKKLKNIKSGKIVSDFSFSYGFFQPEIIVKTSKETSDESDLKTNGRSKSAKKSGNSQKRDVKQHLKTLQEHVELFYYDPEFKIMGVKREIPIKYLFKSIKRNILSNQISVLSYFSIYCGQVSISENKKKNVITVRFFDEVDISNTKLKPSFLISKNYMEQEFPDVITEIDKGEKIYRKAFITLPFILKNKYLNFSSFNSSIEISPFSEELYANVYFK